MPSTVVQGFAKKTGKSEAEVEKLWDKAKAAASKEYPDVEKDSDRYFSIVTGILKKMLGINEETNVIEKLKSASDFKAAVSEKLNQKSKQVVSDMKPAFAEKKNNQK